MGAPVFGLRMMTTGAGAAPTGRMGAPVFGLNMMGAGATGATAAAVPG